MTKPVLIDPALIYESGALVLALDVTHAALGKARRDEGLRHKKIGLYTYYKGTWVLDWLEATSVVNVPESASPPDA